MYKPDRAGHFAFRGLGFSLLVTAFLRGLQLELAPQESRGQPGRERHFDQGDIMNYTFLSTHDRKLLLALESETEGGDSSGTAKCRNPLGRQSELVRREPAERVRLK